MTRALPHDPIGYAVERDTRVVHTRYAKHAPSAQKVRVVRAVFALLDGREPVPCDECYPAPVVRATKAKAVTTSPLRAPKQVTVTPEPKETRTTVRRHPRSDVSYDTPTSLTTTLPHPPGDGT